MTDAARVLRRPLGEGPTPGKRPPRLWGRLSIVLLAAALAFHLLPFPWPTNRFDSGIQLASAELVRAGRCPFADFQSLYTPGAYHLLAGAFALFGDTFDVHSYLDFALLALNAWVAWHVALRAGAGRATALVAFAAGLAFTYPYPALLLALAAIVVAAVPDAGSAWARVVGAGVLAGFAGWFRQDVGAVGAAAAGVAAGVSAAHLRPGRRVVAGVRGLLAAAAARCARLAPALVRDPASVWEGLVTNPLATVPFRDSPGALLAAVRDPAFGLPVAAAVVGAVLASAGAWRAARLGEHARAGILAGLAVVAAWSVRYVALRADAHHLVPGGVVGAIAGCAAFPVRGRGGFVGRAALALAAVAVAFPLARTSAARVQHLTGRRTSAVAGVGDLLPGASTLWLPRDEAADWGRLVGRLRDLTAGGGAFLSACARHDRIADQDLLLYFAVGTLPPVRDFHFDPGVTTREDVQRRIVEDAERAGVAVVVRYDSRGTTPPDGAPPGAHVLDDWIAARFRREERIGRYEVWTR